MWIRRNVLKTAALAALVLGLLAARAGAAEPEEAPPPGVSAGGSAGAPGDSEAPVSARQAATTIIQRTNPFKIEMTRGELPPDESGLSEILLEYYSTEKGRWVGYGLMDLDRERTPGGVGRVTRASINFRAPAEGIFCLRINAKDNAGNYVGENREELPGKLGNADWIVVLDRTPPRVKLLEPSEPGKVFKPGEDVTVRWDVVEEFPAREKGHWYTTEESPFKLRRQDMYWPHLVEVSYDGGISWTRVADRPKPEDVAWKDATGVATDALVIRVRVRDEAGNVGMATFGEALELTVPGAEAISRLMERPGTRQARSAAQQAYQRGVVYMVREDYATAARHLEEAIQLDPGFRQAWIDLSATYLHLADLKRTESVHYGAAAIEKAKTLCTEGLEKFPKEVALHYNLAQALYRDAGDLDAVAERLLAGLEHEPRHLESLYMLALIRYKQGDYDKAREGWKQVAGLAGAQHELARHSVEWLRKLEKKPSRAG